MFLGISCPQLFISRLSLLGKGTRLMMGHVALREPMVVGAISETQREMELRTFVASATAEEVVARLARLETRVVQLDARLRAVREIVDDAGL